MLDGRRSDRSGRVLSALWSCALISMAVLAFYVSLYPIKGFRVAIGSDTSVYVWWARYTGAMGLDSLWVGRPGTVGLLATLSRVLGQQVSVVAASLGPVMAAVAGLSMAAWAECALGASRLRFVLSALLTSAFLSLLVGGYFSTLAFGALFLAALACLSEGLESRARRPMVGASFLLGTAGLVHPQFLALGAVLILGAVAALLPGTQRDLVAGEAFVRTSVGRITLASVGGLVITALGVGAAALAGGNGPALAVDTSRDALLRRTGLTRMVRESYQQKLLHDFPWHRAAAFLGLALIPLGAGCPDGRPVLSPRSDRQKMFWGVLLIWLVVTAASVIALLAGLAVPGQRLAAFCLPLPVLAAVGLVGIRRKGRGPRAGRAAIWVAAGLGVFIAAAWLGWGNQRPVVTPEAVSQASMAGRALAGQPPGTPLILVGDIRTGKPGFLVVRFENYLRGAVPGSRAPDVYVFLGSLEDFLDGRPTLTGHQEHDRIARSSWATLRKAIARDPVAVALQSFHDRTYLVAVRLPGAARLGPGVAVLPGFGGSTRALRSDNRPSPEGSDLPEEEPFSPWTPVWLAPVLLAMVAAIGWPWSRLALPSAGPLRRIALAPAFGLAALSATAVVVDAGGLRLGRVGGFAGLALSVAGGLIALWLSWGGPQGRRANPEPPPPDRPPR